VRNLLSHVRRWFRVRISRDMVWGRIRVARGSIYLRTRGCLLGNKLEFLSSSFDFLSGVRESPSLRELLITLIGRLKKV
jgi:hypothetical protein